MNSDDESDSGEEINYNDFADESKKVEEVIEKVEAKVEEFGNVSGGVRNKRKNK